MMPTADSKSTSFEAHFADGTHLLHRGEAERALPLLKEANRLNPDHFDAALNLSGAYILVGNFKEAVPLLESLSQSFPDNDMVWTNLGAAYLGNPILARSEEQQKAIRAFKQALSLNPLAPNVAYNIGLIFRDQRKTEEAIYWFEEALRVNPDDKDALNNLRRISSGKRDD